jgi:hypothetical protein
MNQWGANLEFPTNPLQFTHATTHYNEIKYTQKPSIDPSEEAVVFDSNNPPQTTEELRLCLKHTSGTMKSEKMYDMRLVVVYPPDPIKLTPTQFISSLVAHNNKAAKDKIDSTKNDGVQGNIASSEPPRSLNKHEKAVADLARKRTMKAMRPLDAYAKEYPNKVPRSSNIDALSTTIEAGAYISSPRPGGREFKMHEDDVSAASGFSPERQSSEEEVDTPQQNGNRYRRRISQSNDSDPSSSPEI